MSFGIYKVKKFFLSVLGGNDTLECEQKNNNVRWKAISEEDKGEAFEEQKSLEQVISFPEELTERSKFLTNNPVVSDIVQITRASVYVSDDNELKGDAEENYEKSSVGISKVNSNSKLFDMDTAAVTFSESEDSADEVVDVTNRLNQTEKPNELRCESSDGNLKQSTSKHEILDKMCLGPDISISNIPNQGTSALSTLVQDIENELQASANITNTDWVLTNERRFDSNNSIDIEKELNELIGALYADIEDIKIPESPVKTENCDDVYNIRTEEPDTENGSNVNLAFDCTEFEDCKNRCTEPGKESKYCQVPDNYWINQRFKSKSFVDRCKMDKLSQRKHRMSMIEFYSKRKSLRQGKSHNSEVFSPKTHLDNDPLIEAQHPNFLSLAYDRSSVVEPRVTSLISLPSRPHSTLPGNERTCCNSEFSVTDNNLTDNSNREGSRSNSIQPSENLDYSSDWIWLEEAMKNLNAECNEFSSLKSISIRVDAGCQTQSDLSWEEEERLRSKSPSLRVSDSATIGVTSECRVVETGVCHEDMPSKAFVEGSGSSGVSTWLRQSMRRVRHFNLEDPPRIRSAPDGLQEQVENIVSEPAVNHTVTNNSRLTPGNEVVLQVARPHSEESTAQRRPPRGRPSSAPARRFVTDDTQQQQRAEVEAPSSSTSSEAQDNLGYESDSMDRHPSPRGRRLRHTDDDIEEPEGRSPLGPWPHGLSSVFAGLGCTLGLFNISRFAVLSVHFGSNFIFQFLILSLLLGVPLFAFHAALGQTLGAGPVDMWKISPLFQGIGIALLLAQALIGMYSIVGVSWMFVYFRDSFITKQDTFTWAVPFRHYRDDNIFGTSIFNSSGRLEETVPDYLNGVVLQRHGLTSPDNVFGHLKFQLTFNLAVVWMIVFVSLSKGLRSYGKVVYVFSVLPVLGVLVICSKLLGMTPLHLGFFPQTEWSEFFLNAKSWISAATEVMLTWNLLGAAIMQVTSHNRSSKKLWRDVATISLLTLIVLILAAFLGNMCHQLISLKGYSYVPSSFERISTYTFLRPSGAPLPPSYAIPIRHMPHASLVAGDRVGKPGVIHESGYQVIRLATELVPTTLAILHRHYLSPFWAVLFYFTLILFGIAQQLAIWHCVITGIMAINAPSLKSWETTITFFTCGAGFVLGLPMTTELGIYVVYFLDYCLGGGWWVVLLTLMEICAVLMVRGRPYSGENISIALFGKTNNCVSLWAIPLLTFTWNVIMPVALLVICITIFKSGGYRDLWIWRCGKGDYWPLWTREVGVFVQIIPLLCIPIVGLIQCYRYLSKGPADIFDRLANLYRPAAGLGFGVDENLAPTPNIPPSDSTANGTGDLSPTEDPPPKYTPPPSYSTATGSRIAKLLRQSIRRSVRRIQSALGPEIVQPPRPPPPDYASVLVEMNQNVNDERDVSHSTDTNNFTAADVVNTLRCSFRRTNNSNAQASHETANPQNLVIPPHWNL